MLRGSPSQAGKFKHNMSVFQTHAQSYAVGILGIDSAKYLVSKQSTPTAGVTKVYGFTLFT